MLSYLSILSDASCTLTLLDLSGTLSSTHPDWKSADEPSSTVLAHKFSFASAYEPLSHPITHAEDSFRACIDYIYYSKKLEPICLLQLPQITAECPLPNNDYASDHLMIAMQFLLSHS